MNLTLTSKKGRMEKGRDYIAISVLQRNLHLMENDHKLTISGKKGQSFVQNSAIKWKRHLLAFFLPSSMSFNENGSGNSDEEDDENDEQKRLAKGGFTDWEFWKRKCEK